MQFVQFVAARADTGAVLPYASATVYLSGTSTLASLFDETGAETGNPATGTATGEITVSATDGVYDVQITSADGSYSLPLIKKMQLADLAGLVGTITSGRVGHATYAELATITGGASGMLAEVPSADTGTHTDPVVGGTVANSGVFRWSASPAGWQWLYPSESSRSTASSTLAGHYANDSADVDVPGGTVGDRGAKFWALSSASSAAIAAATLLADKTALSHLYDSPNQTLDPLVNGSGWSGAVTLGNRSGRKSIIASGAARSMSIPVASLGGAGANFSVGLTLEAIAAASGVFNGIKVEQYTAAGAFISGTQVYLLGPTTAVPTTPVEYKIEGQAISATAAVVELTLDVGANAANLIEVSLLGIYPGNSAAFRPGAQNGDPLSQAESVREGLSVAFLEPNLFVDANFKFASSTSLGVWNTAAPVISVNSRGRKIGTFTGKAESYVDHPAAWFGGPTAPVSFICTIENQVYASGTGNLVYLKFLDTSGAEILPHQTPLSSMMNTTSDVVIKAENIVIPAGCVTVRVSFYTGGSTTNSISFSRIGLFASAKADYRPAIVMPVPSRTVYVDGTNGSDINDGSAAAPFATTDRALQALRTADNLVSGRMIIRGGDYIGASITLGSIQGVYRGFVSNLVVEAAPNERVRFILGTALTGITKSSGYTNVYQAPLSAKNAPRNFMFEHETPEGLIPLAERHPNHLGLAYRCPSYRMVQAPDLATCDGKPASWYYDSVNAIIYFHAPADGDPTANGKTYYLPSTDPSTSKTYYKTTGFGGAAGMLAADQGKIGHLEVRGIEVWYGYRGFDMTGVGSYLLENCTSIGAWGQNFQFGCNDGTDINCRALAAGEDGFGSTGQSVAEGTGYRNQRCVSINFYSAMNYDDGRSMHERTNDTVYGGLSEYNYDSGAAYVLGSEAVLYNTEFRRNGQGYGIVYPTDSSLTGEGLTVRQGPSAAEGGVNTCVVGHGIVSDGNRYNFSCGIAGNNLRLYSPKSINALVAGYRGVGGEMDVYDGRTMNETAKEISGGTINVYASTALAA